MDLQSVANYRFIPEAGENAKSESPVAFVCNYLTPSEMNGAVKQQAVAEGSNAEVRMVINKDELVRKGLESVENLSIDGKQISSQREFSATRHPLVNQWFNELANEIIRRTNEEEEVLKN